MWSSLNKITSNKKLSFTMRNAYALTLITWPRFKQTRSVNNRLIDHLFSCRLRSHVSHVRHFSNAVVSWLLTMAYSNKSLKSYSNTIFSDLKFRGFPCFCHCCLLKFFLKLTQEILWLRWFCYETIIVPIKFHDSV